MSFNVNTRVEPSFTSHQPRRQKFYLIMKITTGLSQYQLAPNWFGQLVLGTINQGRLTRGSL